MKIRGLIFDINSTLVDIKTDEGRDVFRVVANLLSYQGVALGAVALKELYFQLMKEQRAASAQMHPEFDAVAIFRKILEGHSSEYTKKLPTAKREQLPLLLAETFRAASRFRLELYPGVQETLSQLRSKYLLAAVTDGQSAYGVPEINAVGLAGYFDPIVVSGDLGYRKPDQRMFELALEQMKLVASEALFIGNDMYRDVFGAQQVGMKAVLFKTNQGDQEKEGTQADYVIYKFPELIEALRFVEAL